MRDQTKCGKCGEERDYTIKSGKRAGKLHTYCRSCLRKQVKRWENDRPADWNAKRLQEWLKRNPSRRLRYGMRRYGVDEHWYLGKLEEQKGVCAICHKPENKLGTRVDGQPRRLSVDHCHKSQRLRGLLCNTCNMRLAGLEAHDWFSSAMAYLAQYQP